MPYIENERQREIAPNCEAAFTAGELNFQITTLLVKYLVRNGTSYGTINDALGALDGAGRELWRRVGAPYEEIKRLGRCDPYSPVVHSPSFTPKDSSQ